MASPSSLLCFFNRIRGMIKNICESVVFLSRLQLVVCISPLTSLEVDLTGKLRSRGINAAYVGEQQKDW